MSDLYKKYIREEFDENGVLTYYRTIVPEGFNFAYDVIDRHAEEMPDSPAYLHIDADGKKTSVTFKQLAALVNKTANFFASIGVKKDDKVLVVLKRHKEFWQIAPALCKIGAVLIPATSMLAGKDFLYRFETAEVKHIICTADGDAAPVAETAVKTYKDIKNKIIVNGKREGWTSFSAGVDKASETFKRTDFNKNSDIMLLYFTSGTTGYPKMVAHDYTYPAGHIYTARHWQNVKPGGLHFTVSDTGWAKAAWGKLYGQWFLGAGIFIYDFDKFEVADLLSRMAENRVTSFCAPPTIYRHIIKEDLKRFDLSALVYAATAGEALSAEVYERFYLKTGLKIMEGFGQTETTLLSAHTVNMPVKHGSMGRPSVQYDVRIFDEDGNETADGVTGEICVRYSKIDKPAGLLTGYYKAPEATAKATHYGYFHTGDTAWRDEDGYFWFVGRKDDIIKSSGYRIGPFEVESVIIEHPSVLECAVIGVPDEVRGQAVKAFIVLAKGYEQSEELKKEIQSYCKNNTAPYKYPRIVEFVNELPKTVSGKIIRTELRR